MRMGEAAVVACLVAAAAASVAGQQQYPSHFSASLAARPDVQRALAFIDDRFAAQVKEWIALTEIPGTSTHEARSRRDFFGADVNDEPRYRRVPGSGVR